MARFAFRFHPVYRALGLPFGVTPGTTMVEVHDGRLSVRFGPWSLTTPLSNVVRCERTGPFSIPKTAGPAHLSLVDHGVTFATNPDAGLCLCFDEPVPAIEPFKKVLHPGLTVTVDRLDDLERALSGGLSPAEAEALPGGAPAESPWQVCRRWTRWPGGIMLATARYVRGLGEIDRTFECREQPGPAGPERHRQAGAHDEQVQDLAAGVGPIFERTYRVRIAGSRRTPEDLLAYVAADFNRASPVEVAEFCERPTECGPGVRAEYDVRMPGPWDGPVRIVEETPTSIRLATLDGHMEAGEIEFRTHWADPSDPGSADRDVVFEVHSVARSGDRPFDVLYSLFPIAREMQLHTWVHFCRRVAEMAEGTVVGKLEVRTVRYRSRSA